MSRVEKFNPLKRSALSEQRDGLKSEAFREITFDLVREDAVNFGLVTDVLFQMNAGKEASIFLAEWKGHTIVLKVYRLWHSSHKLSKSKGYLTAATSKRVYHVLGMIEDIAVAEYDILMKCFRAGVHVPTPIGRVGNYITMRFIGDERESAPQLKDVHLDDPEGVLNQIFDDYFVMYKDVHYVHGDLSKYNILWWKNRPWFIDVPQAYKVGPWSNMKEAVSLLRRDVENVLSYFEQYDIYRDPDSIVEIFLNAYVPRNLRHFEEDMLPLTESSGDKSV